MTSRRYRKSTAFVASLTLLIPQTAQMAQAQDADPLLLCLDQTEPPCPEGEPVDGTPADHVPTSEAAAPDALVVDTEEAEAQAEADVAADHAETDPAAPQAEADAAVADQAAIDQAAVDEAAADEAAAQAEADAAAADQAATDQAAADEAAADEAAAQAEADAAAADQAAIDQAAADEAAADEAAAQAEADGTEPADAVSQEGAIEEVVIEDAPADPDSTEELDAAAIQAEIDATRAEQADAETQVEIVDEQTAAQEEMPAVDPTMDEEPTSAAAAAADSAGAADEAPQVQEEVLDDTNTRSAEQEFETTVADGAEVTDTDDGGMTNFERALLIGIGAVAVGALINNGRDEVVANTGDRVVVQGENGLTVYRDDDALLRQSGATLRTETFGDGSTRSVLTRDDGTQVITIRDARGRVLQRTTYLVDGTEVLLFDDLTETHPVDVVQLRASKPAGEIMTVSQAGDTGLEDYLGSALIYDPGRTFSLRQIREIADVRTLVSALDLDMITFASGSAAIDASQLQSLVGVGIALENMLARNPGEVFLIEGHTDATGSDALNLALSDRRAETVALALTQNFAIPPENLVVQGYGEQFLIVPTQASEAANRRATVRRITPLLQVAAN